MASTKNSLHKAFGIDVAAHGGDRGIDTDDNVNLKVIGLGLSRTGTTSLSAAFEILGLGPSHQGVDLFRSPQRTEAFHDIYTKLLNGTWKAGDPALSERLVCLMRGYRSTTDGPINYFTREIYAAYPSVLYVLGVRDGGAAEWWSSFMAAVGLHFSENWDRTVFRTLILPVGFIRRTDDYVQLMRQLWIKRFGSVDQQLYDKHNAEVKQVIPADQLLVFQAKQGWEPLCKFLDLPAPSQPFPNLNDTASMKAIYFGMQAYGALFWVLYFGVVGGAGYLAYRPEVARGLLEKAISWISRWRIK